jgi:hypothetical protein
MGSNQVWAIKTNEYGFKEWDKTIFTNGTDRVGYGVQTPDGCYAFANYTEATIAGYQTQVPRPLEDYWIVKFCDTSFRANLISTNTQSCNNNCNGAASVVPFYGVAPYHYLWQPANDTTATVNNLCAGFNNVTITDAGGRTLTKTIVITSLSSPAVSINTSDTTICASDSARICAVSTATNYVWNNNATTACVYTSLAGNYYVTVTGNNGCTTVSNHIAINVLTLPSVSISVNGDTLNAYGAYTYQWYLNDNVIAGATDSTYIVQQSGSYTVAVTNGSGCTAFSNDILITGIQPSIAHPQFSIYPNPATTQLNISVDQALRGAQLNVYDVTGALVHSTKLETTNLKLETVRFANGVYIAEVKTTTGSQRVKWVKM